MQATLTNTAINLRQVQVNGTDLNYIEKGSGESVVFIHGAVSDFRAWLEQVNFFSKDFKTISYSRRFHQPNNNAKSVVNYSRTQHTGDLVAFLKALNLKKVHLVGHSYGASIALLTALQHPELVGSLVLGEPSPLPEFLDEEGMTLLEKQKESFAEVMQLAQVEKIESAVREFLKIVIGVDVLDLLPEERRFVVLENADTLLPLLRTYYDSPPIRREQLNSLNTQTLLVCGELSPRISKINSEMINRCLPNSRIAMLKGASHGLHVENAKDFNQTVLDFLANNSN